MKLLDEPESLMKGSQSQGDASGRAPLVPRQQVGQTRAWLEVSLDGEVIHVGCGACGATAEGSVQEALAFFGVHPYGCDFEGRVSQPRAAQ